MSTGLMVDIKGLSQPVGKDYCIALRTAIDAVNIKEINQDLFY